MTLIEALAAQDFSKSCSISFHLVVETPRQVGIINPSEVFATRIGEVQTLWDPNAKPPRRPRKKKDPEGQFEDGEALEDIYGGDDDLPGGLLAIADEIPDEAEQARDFADEAAFAAGANEESDWEDDINKAIQLSLGKRAGDAPVDPADLDLPDDANPFQEDVVEQAPTF